MNDSEKRLIVFAILGAGIVFMIPSVDAKKSRNHSEPMQESAVRLWQITTMLS